MIEASTYAMKPGDSDTPKKHGFSYYPNIPSSVDIVFTLMEDMRRFHPPNILGSNSYWIVLIADGVFSLKVQTEVDISNLNKVSSMEVRLNPWKN